MNIEDKIKEIINLVKEIRNADVVIHLDEMLDSVLNDLADQVRKDEREKTVKEIMNDYGDYNNGCFCCADNKLKDILKEDYLSN